MLDKLATAALGACAGSIDRAAERLADAARVARFLRGRLELTPRPDDVFISSYPRSGTTWMQFIVLQLVRSAGPEPDRVLDYEHISQVTPWYERSLAVGSRTARDLDAMPAPRVFKSHLPLRWLPPAGRCIYMVRDGMDVARSYYHFYRSHLRFEGSFDAFYRRFLAGDLQYGSWFKHVAGWRAHADDPRVLIVRYEQLRHRFDATLERVAAHLGVPLPADLAARIAERSSFAFMKRHESKFDFTTEVLLERGVRRSAFLRAGAVGEGAELTPAQQERFRRRAARRVRLADLELDLARFLH